MHMLKDAKDCNQEDLTKLFKDTCIRLDFEGIKYLLTSPDLSLRPDIHNNNDEAFAWIINGEEDGSLEIIKYLITQHNLEKTYSINNILNRMPTDYMKSIENMFVIRDLNKELNEELVNNSIAIKKVKI
jgi:hypothetical protein